MEQEIQDGLLSHAPQRDRQWSGQPA